MTVVLAIGFDPWLFESQRSVWRSAGYFVTSASSIGESIHQLKSGDFDLVVVSYSIPAESIERLISMIRASGSRIPVVRISDSSSDEDEFSYSTIKNEPNILLQNIEKLLANPARA
jgi:DNA-binding response OmpR family regulator